MFPVTEKAGQTLVAVRAEVLQLPGKLRSCFLKSMSRKKRNSTSPKRIRISSTMVFLIRQAKKLPVSKYRFYLILHRRALYKKQSRERPPAEHRLAAGMHRFERFLPKRVLPVHSAAEKAD